MPGRSSVIATCSPAMRLKSVDFPTFGRPTTTTVGNSVFSVIMRPNASLSVPMGMTSAGTGRSSTESPSRNCPASDKQTSGRGSTTWSAWSVPRKGRFGRDRDSGVSKMVFSTATPTSSGLFERQSMVRSLSHPSPSQYGDGVKFTLRRCGYRHRSGAQPVYAAGFAVARHPQMRRILGGEQFLRLIR